MIKVLQEYGIDLLHLMFLNKNRRVFLKKVGVFEGLKNKLLGVVLLYGILYFKLRGFSGDLLFTNGAENSKYEDDIEDRGIASKTPFLYPDRRDGIFYINNDDIEYKFVYHGTEICRDGSVGGKMKIFSHHDGSLLFYRPVEGTNILHIYRIDTLGTDKDMSTLIKEATIFRSISMCADTMPHIHNILVTDDVTYIFCKKPNTEPIIFEYQGSVDYNILFVGKSSIVDIYLKDDVLHYVSSRRSIVGYTSEYYIETTNSIAYYYNRIKDYIKRVISYTT